MTAKQFLLQAQGIDKQIKNKLKQIESLRSLAERATSTISPMPHSPAQNTRRMEGTIVKMLDLENEINVSIDKLLDTKRKVVEVIDLLPKVEHRAVLEHRYICGKTWEKIASEMAYNERSVRRFHKKALCEIEKILGHDSK